MRRKQAVDHRLEAGHLRLDAGEAVHERDIAERIGGPFRELGIILLDELLQRLGLAHHKRCQRSEDGAQDEQDKRKPPVEHERERQQHEEGDESREIVAEEAKPQAEQGVGPLQHDLHQAAGMRCRMKGERQLQHMLEVIGERALALPMGEPVGVERNQRAAYDVEQAEGRPGREQAHELRPAEGSSTRLRLRQRVDHAAEQHGFGELRGGQQEIGDGKRPGKPRGRRQQAERPQIDADEIHAASREGWPT